MDAVTFLLSQIDDLNNIQAARVTIVELIRWQLARLKHSPDECGNMHLTNAIGALALNVDALMQPTNAWLRLCLADLDEALASSEECSKSCAGRAIDAEGVNHDKLEQALESVARKIAPSLAPGKA
jgi:hypothetical protein